jgi:DNA mismatch repair protein MSH4
MATPRPSTSFSSVSTSYQTGYPTSSFQPLQNRRSSTTRPTTGRRSRAASTIGGGESQQIICAISEGRGISPTVGLAFVNISTGEAVLSQICDNQFYARTLNKLQVFEPTEILVVSTTGPPNPKSKMFQVVEENILGAKIVTVDRRHWSEAAGLEYIQELAFVEDAEAIKVAIGGNYFATCCFAAVGPVPLRLLPSYHLTNSGSQVYQLEPVFDVCLSFSSHQIPALGGLDDDRSFYYSIP